MHWPKERRQIPTYMGQPKQTHESHTSTGRKFALDEGLSHDLESVPDPFIMSILRGRCATVNDHPVLNLITQ